MMRLHRSRISCAKCTLFILATALVLGQGIAVAQEGADDPIDFCGNFEGNSALEAAAGGALLTGIDLNGSYTLNPPGSVPLFLITPNGVPDAANELGLLQAILNDETFDNGLITHAEVKEAWDDNFETLTKNHIGNSIIPFRPQTTVLQQVAPGFIDILVAYLTLGDGTFVKDEVAGTIQASGSFGFVASLIDQFNGLLDDLQPLLPENLRPPFSLFNPVLNKDYLTTLYILTVVNDADADGDGLTNLEEFELFAPATCQVAAPAKGDIDVNYVTAALSPDADGDGMPDNYEVAHAVLDPSVPDGELDPDGDLLINLDEFFEGSDPADIDSPKVTRFVAAGGTTDIAGGTAESPWGLATGLTQLSGGMGDSQLVLGGGTYSGNITLATGSGIVGPPNCDLATPGDCAILLGTVIGAPGAVAQDVTLQATAPDLVLLQADDGAMTVTSVRFDGAGQSNVVGIRTAGPGSGDTTIARCAFTGLAIGIEVLDDLPTLRRSIFEDSGNGITIRALGKKNVAKSLGDVTDPNSGFNSFMSSVAPLAVLDERGVPDLSLQNNDWNIDDDLGQAAAEAEIEARISGSATIVPFAARGATLLAAAVFCTVTNSETQAKILNASIALEQGTTVIGPVIENFEGVYAFPALSAGTYNLSVSVPGLEETFETRLTEITLAGGELKALNIPLAAPKMEEPPPTSKGGCYAGQSTNTSTSTGGDIALALLLTLALAYAGHRRTTRNQA
jgi:hypothetical protein